MADITENSKRLDSITYILYIPCLVFLKVSNNWKIIRKRVDYNIDRYWANGNIQ